MNTSRQREAYEPQPVRLKLATLLNYNRRYSLTFSNKLWIRAAALV